jgi:NhaP-type Na+/H+ or K+/H+ antiporter
LWAILFFSKILILEVVDVIFEEDVDLGGFLNVLILVLAMMVARRLSFAIFRRLGPPEDAPAPPASTPGAQRH